MSVTDSRQLQTLEKSEAHLRLAMDVGRMGSWEWDVPNSRVEWSPALEALHGLAPGTFEGTLAAFQRDIHPDDRELVYAAIRKTIEDREPHHLEYRIILPDGRTRWVEARGRLFVDDDEAPVRLVGICMDITERKTFEEALVEHRRQLEARNRLSSLAADIGFALTQADRLGTILQRCAQAVVDRLDAAFARIWTVNEPEQVLELRASAGMYTHIDGPHGRVPIGKFKIGLIAEERAPHLTNQVVGDPRVGDQAWAEREGMVAFAGYPLMLGNELVGVLAMFARHPLEEQDFASLATVGQGISLGIARGRAMDALRESEAQAVRRADALARITSDLQRTNAELDAFAYAASHDLRAPLRGVANLSQWIEEDLQGSLRAETREMLALMRARMHRMEGLIDGILQYSRAGRAREEPVRVDTRQLAEEVVDLLAPAAATVIVDPSLPDITTERLPLQQVLQNLIANGIKHGGPGVTVRIGAEDLGSAWKFSVADDGPGIPAQFHERIWAIFQTLAPRDTVEGAGIGLSLVKKLVEAQGGTVALESTPGAGAAFTFTWPKTGRAEVE